MALRNLLIESKKSFSFRPDSFWIPEMVRLRDQVKINHKYKSIFLRIFMGSKVTPHGFPWIVRIEINDSSGRFCGGNIIGQKWILTGNGNKNNDFK